MDAFTFLAGILMTSAAAGAAGAVLGLGGGILLVPVLTLFYGIDLHAAMGASIISVVATSSGAAAAYLRSGLSNIRIGLFLAMATVSGAMVGATLVGVVPERSLLLVLGGALAYSAFVSLRQLRVELPAQTKPFQGVAARFRLAGAYHDGLLDRHVRYHAASVGLGATAMFVAGVLSGLLGIGSGAFKVVAMDNVMRLPMKVSTATSNFMIGITAAASAGIYFGRGDIHPVLVTPVAVGILLGAYAGTRVLGRLRNSTLRKLFLPVILYLAASLIARGLGISLT